MIFTALGLLVLAAVLLIAGITKSSQALLMLSLVSTVGAGAALAIAYSVARRSGVITEAAPAGGSGAAAAGGAPLPPADPNTAAVVMYVPVEQLQSLAPAAAAARSAANGHANGSGAGAPPIAGYDEMSAEQLGKLIASGALTDAQLQAVRDYEAAHAARKSVLSRIDRRLYSDT